jgi:aspartyl-tRNA(Asn)/glutamyl-tRNA(Gln) amidotransferase subunit C
MVDAKVIKHVAKLAKLEISENDLNKYSDQLVKVLSQFEEIKTINTEGIEPLVTPVELDLFFREDIAKTPNSVEELLENAPEKTGHLFTVPPVI